jgi:hypothetical protein
MSTAGVLLLFLIILSGSATAQSKDRTQPTQLRLREISGVINDSNAGDTYYYRFDAGPGELKITLTVEATKKSTNTCDVSFEIFNEDALPIGSGRADAMDGDTDQKIERIDLPRRQTVLLKLRLTKNEYLSRIGVTSSGKFLLRLDGATYFGATVDDVNAAIRRGPTVADVNAAESSRRGECLPRQGTLIVKMKDGSKKIIDLSEAETVTIVP